jgi:hypothetical protein
MAKKFITLSGKIKRIHASENDTRYSVVFTLEGDNVVHTMVANYEVYTNSLRLTSPGDVVHIDAREDTGVFGMQYPTILTWTNITLDTEMGRSQPAPKY